MPETNKPLSVAIASVVNNNKILLIKRVKEPYAGKWAFPGGKVEHGEHISEAVIRELLEETSIETKNTKHLGVISEHLIENNEIIEHFLLHVFEVNPNTLQEKESSEGKVSWFSLDDLANLQNLMVPSDFAIMKKYVKEKQTGYTECVMEKHQNQYTLKKFE